MVESGLIIGTPGLQKLQNGGDLTMSKGGNTSNKEPPHISLNDKTIDVSGGIADSPEEDKNEEKKTS